MLQETAGVLVANKTPLAALFGKLSSKMGVTVASADTTLLPGRVTSTRVRSPVAVWRVPSRPLKETAFANFVL